MFRRKFIDRLKDRYQRGGLRNPLFSIQTKTLHPSGKDPRIGLGAKFSGPLLEAVNHGKYTTGLRFETDFTGTNMSPISLSKRLYDSQRSEYHLTPEQEARPKTYNAAVGLRGYHNRFLDKRNELALKTSLGAGIGTGDEQGDTVMNPYADINLSLIKSKRTRKGRTISGGPTLSYGTEGSPTAGLRTGLTGSYGRLSGNIDYDITNRTPRAGISYNFQKGGFDNKGASLLTKAVRAMPGIAGSVGSKILGPIGLMLGAKKAYGGQPTLSQQGLSDVNIPLPSGRSKNVTTFGLTPMNTTQVSNVNQQLAAAMAPKTNQTGGMYDQMRQYQEGGLPKKVIQNYENLGISSDILNQLNTTPSDTVLSVKNHPDLGASSMRLLNEAKFSGKIRPDEYGNWEQDTRVYKGDKGYTRYSKFKKQMGGVALPGGQMQQIPGSDAVQFTGASHNQGGIMLDPQTEVEGGETMDQVTMAKHGGKRKDYFFSSYLKEGGRSYADMHKDILANGGDQKEINMLARMQEVAADRDPNQIAKKGGIKKYGEGGPNEHMDLLINSANDGGAAWEAHQQEEHHAGGTGDDTQQYGPNSPNPYGPPMDIGVSWSNQGGGLFGSGFGLKGSWIDNLKTKALDWGKGVWDRSGTLGKIGIGAAGVLPAIGVGSAIAGDYAGFKDHFGLKDSFLDRLLRKGGVRHQTGGIDTWSNQDMINKEALIEKYGANIGGDHVTFTDQADNPIPIAGASVNKKTGINKIWTDRSAEGLTSSDTLYYNQNTGNLAQYDPVDPMNAAGLITDHGAVWEPNKSFTAKDFKKYRKKITKKQMGGMYDQQQYQSGGFGQEDEDYGIYGKSGNRLTLEEIREQYPEYAAEIEKRQKLAESQKGATTTTGGFFFPPQDNPYAILNQPDLNLTTLEEEALADEQERLEGDELGEYTVLTPEEQLYKPIKAQKELERQQRIDYNALADAARKKAQKGRGVPTAAWVGMGAQLIPSMYAFLNKQKTPEEIQFTPGFTSPIKSSTVKARRLDRVNFNDKRSALSSSIRGMNKFIETSGGGPANMANLQATLAKDIQGQMQINAAETKANIAIDNKEKELAQQAALDNVKRAQAASSLNAKLARAEAARADEVEALNVAAQNQFQADQETNRMNALIAASQGIAGGAGDIMSYRAGERMAKMMGSEGIYERDIMRDFVAKRAKKDGIPGECDAGECTQKQINDFVARNFGQKEEAA